MNMGKVKELMKTMGIDDPRKALRSYVYCLHKSVNELTNPSKSIPKELIDRFMLEIKNSNHAKLNVRNLEIAVLDLSSAVELCDVHGDSDRNITMIVPKHCKRTSWMCDQLMEIDYVDLGLNKAPLKKFDLIIGFPPETENRPGKKKPIEIWQNMVASCHGMLKENGIMAVGHPSSWRGCGQTLSNQNSKIRNLLKSMDMIWLQIHKKFDMHVSRKSNTLGFMTKVMDQKGNIQTITIKTMPFIPSHSYGRIGRLIAGPDDETLDVRFTGKYNPHNNKRMSTEKNDNHVHPCLWSKSKKKNEFSYKYSSIRGDFFDVPKLIAGIWNNKWTFMDLEGEYAMCHHAVAILDTKSNLKNIEKAMNNPEFIHLMDSTIFTTEKGWNKNVLKHLRKDFWKEFV